MSWSLHDVAAAGFGGEADAYERARPSYPPDAVAWLADALGVAPGRTVVDLAAGTGKLTRLLAPFGSELYAVEPVAGMRAYLAATVPGVPTLSAARRGAALRGRIRRRHHGRAGVPLVRRPRRAARVPPRPRAGRAARLDLERP